MSSASQLPALRTLQKSRFPTAGSFPSPPDRGRSSKHEQEYPVVWRRDRVPTLTVQADMRPGELPEAGVDALAPAIKEISASLPKGYQIAVEGTVEESAKSQASVLAVIPLMLFMMITFLMIQLQSFNLLALVLCIVPMGLKGIIAALLLVGKPLGFVAILGIWRSLGMIARNAVILIDQIETERGQGRDIWDAVVEATLFALPPDHTPRPRSPPCLA